MSSLEVLNIGLDLLAGLFENLDLLGLFFLKGDVKDRFVDIEGLELLERRFCRLYLRSLLLDLLGLDLDLPSFCLNGSSSSFSTTSMFSSESSERYPEVSLESLDLEFLRSDWSEESADLLFLGADWLIHLPLLSESTVFGLLTFDSIGADGLGRNLGLDSFLGTSDPLDSELEFLDLFGLDSNLRLPQFDSLELESSGDLDEIF